MSSTTITLDHCDEVLITLPAVPYSGTLDLDVGGQSGEGSVSAYTLVNRQGLIGTVDTDDSGLIAISNKVALWLHYEADPSAPQSVSITYSFV